MNQYRVINCVGQCLGSVYAITPGAAVIAWRLTDNEPFSAVRAVRQADLLDDVVELAELHLPGALRAFGNDARYAYRHAHGYARDLITRDPMGDHFGRNR